MVSIYLGICVACFNFKGDLFLLDMFLPRPKQMPILIRKQEAGTGTRMPSKGGLPCFSMAPERVAVLVRGYRAHFLSSTEHLCGKTTLANTKLGLLVGPAQEFLAVGLDLWAFDFWEIKLGFPLHPQTVVNFLQGGRCSNQEVRLCHWQACLRNFRSCCSPLRASSQCSFPGYSAERMQQRSLE